jgi:hypothetical protein
MDFDARLKALARLAESTTPAAERALRHEFDTAVSRLATATDYDHLEQSLAVVDTIGFRFSGSAVSAVDHFVRSIDGREFTYTEQDRLLGGAFKTYRNAAALIVHAVQALVRLRYLETRAVLHALMPLSVHTSESVRKKALEGLEELSSYDITVFHGDGQHGGIGAAPQMEILDEIQKLSDPDVTTYLSAVLILLQGVLSPTMESASWSYKTLTLSRSATPAISSVSEVRLQSIDQLMNIYRLVLTIDQKLRVVGLLTNATRTETRTPRSDEASAMFVRDTQKVLAFFAELAENDELQLVQKIEHNSYWIFVHAIAEEVRIAALRVYEKISERAEYQIYRVLIGFEGIFGDWRQRQEGGDEWKETEELRRKTARDYVEHISDGNYAEWCERIFKYAQTKSDDLATFPIFYYFLESFAGARPELAFRLLSENDESIKGFLIPLMRGLWSGSHREQLRALIEAWAREGRNLFPSTKQFLSNPDLDVALVKRLLFRAQQLKDLSPIREVISVAVSNYSTGRHVLIDELMLPALEALSEQSNANWIFDNWYRPELKEVLASLETHGVDAVLANLKHLRELDYHAEEVLYILAQRSPDKVLAYLCSRLEEESHDADHKRTYEAIPYELHKLDEPLSTIPELVVRMLRDRYAGDYSHFMYRGARLLKNIFPQLPPEFGAELLKVIGQGGEKDYEFVLAILRNYRGEPFTHRISKELVKAMPSDSPLRSEVAIALHATGVVSGEYGMADAYERKRQEMLDWLTDPDDRVQAFAREYVADLARMSDAERKLADEQIALRKFQFGEG